ncbi:MAG: aspartate aminotransferase family protein [Bacteroidetes bacterium]|nr:aspartate aminotransferase family protein [Bacteroidota bacterium]
MNQRELFLRHVGQTSDAPIALEIVRAEGCTLWDAHGKQYLDLIGGISVCNMGHRHPAVVAAAKEQLDAYLHVMVYGELIESPQVQYAASLSNYLPAALDTVFFTSSGTEATEGAMKLAKRYTGKPKIVAFDQSYHGSTQGALSVMGSEYWRNAFRPLLPGIVHLPHGVLEVLDAIDDQTACVIAEPIQAERGVVRPTNEWMHQLRNRCDEVGALLILDEIQTGMGRTGSLFAFQQTGIVPDIVLLGKAFGAGMPLGAFVAAREKMSVLTHDPVLGHISTFGGHPVCCAAGMAGFHALLASGCMDQVTYKSQLFKHRLRHSLIHEVRTAGLLMAVEFESWDINKRVIDRCIELGVFTDWFLFAQHCMRLAPPLIISEEEIAHACTIILQACDEIANA